MDKNITKIIEEINQETKINAPNKKVTANINMPPSAVYESTPFTSWKVGLRALTTIANGPQIAKKTNTIPA